MAAAEPRLGVFVSYSHADDSAWLERVQVHLKPLVRAGQVDLWDDTRIRSGERWREEIQSALARAKVAVLLISADFYASDFIADNELPRLLDAEREHGLVILGLHLNHSRFDRDRVLSEYQTINVPDQPIEALPKAQQEQVFDALARRIEELLDPRGPEPAASPERTGPPPMLGRLRGLPTRPWRGMSGAVVAVILLAIVGALALAIGLAGDRITAIGASVVGGDVKDSAITIRRTSPERVPLQWATTQNNLGNALQTLGERESGTARLEDAVAAYRAALEEYTRERVPLQWATTQNNLGTALRALGQRQHSLSHLQDAHAAVQAAYEVYVIEAKQTHYEDYFQARLAEVEQQIAALKGGPVAAD